MPRAFYRWHGARHTDRHRVLCGGVLLSLPRLVNSPLRPFRAQTSGGETGENSTCSGRVPRQCLVTNSTKRPRQRTRVGVIGKNIRNGVGSTTSLLDANLAGRFAQVEMTRSTGIGQEWRTCRNDSKTLSFRRVFVGTFTPLCWCVELVSSPCAVFVMHPTPILVPGTADLTLFSIYRGLRAFVLSILIRNLQILSFPAHLLLLSVVCCDATQASC